MRIEDISKLIGKLFDAFGIIGSVIIILPRILQTNNPLTPFEFSVLASVAVGLLFGMFAELLTD